MHGVARIRAAVQVALVCLAPVASLAAQDTTAALPVDTVAAVDSVSVATVPQLRKPPVSPGGALIRSLLIPGWGQAKMGRNFPAAFFLAVEGASLGFALKANSELKYFRETNDARADAKSQEREDWLVIMGVNHLIAGIEAYVSAYLWDFPGDLRLRPTPNGTAATLSIPVRFP